MVEPSIGLLMREEIGNRLGHERSVNNRVFPRVDGAGINYEGCYSDIGNVLHP